jgi:Type II secretion system (T2SS), protein M subtype b
MSLSARERRLLAIGALVLALAVAWMAAVRPLIAGFAERAAEREHVSQEIAIAHTLLAQRPIWQARFRRLAEDSADFGPGDADAATTRATDQVLSAAAAQGVPVSAIRPQGGSDGLARMSVDMRADLPQAVTILKALERAKPYLIVESVSLAADPEAAAGRAGAMNVMVDIGAPYVAYSR